MNPERLKTYVNTQFEKGECYVAFLDILGYKKLVKKYLNPECDQDLKIKEDIKYALQKSVKSLEGCEEDNFLELIRYKNFSDCTCYSIPTSYGEETEATTLFYLIIVVTEFTFQLMINNIYHRGGISFGYHYQDEYMIFSEGLIKAYKLEDEIADFPRTILDEKVVQQFKRLWIEQKENVLDFGMEKKIIIDKEGIVFINPFNLIKSLDKWSMEKLRTEFSHEMDFNDYLLILDKSYHDKIQDNLEKMIEEYKDDERVLPKYLWLRELLFWNMDPESSDKFEYFLK